MKRLLLILTFFIIFPFLILAQEFTIAVIPDSQNYVNEATQKSSSYSLDSAQIFYNQMKYIADNSEANDGSISFVVHVGDHVSHWGNKEGEWERAEKAMTIIDGIIPFIAVPGNHDYDIAFDYGTGKNNRIDGGKHYNKYFGPDSKFFKNKEWYKGSYFNGMNSYVIYNIKGIDFLFIGLEFEPSDNALEWAQSVINENLNLPTIIVTHGYLSLTYEKEAPGKISYWRSNYRKGYAETTNTGQQIWDKLIKNNQQIFMVLCGHIFQDELGESVRTDVNENGYKVYSLLQNYQGRKSLFDELGLKGKKLNCGDGWLRLLNFDIDKKTIQVQTYNTETKKYEPDADSKFIIELDWDWYERFK